MLKTKKINSEKVEPVIASKIKPEKIKGFSLFPEIYANIFLCARKKSGKTSAIFKILQSCVNKDTKIVIFASTINKDDTLIHIVNYFKKKKNTVHVFSSTKEEKIDLLKEILDTLKKMKKKKKN